MTKYSKDLEKELHDSEVEFMKSVNEGADEKTQKYLWRKAQAKRNDLLNYLTEEE